MFQQPTYTSIYPIAPAVLMAIPKLLGATPWLGVWLAAGLMCLSICWMLQGWLPPEWAFLGGLLAVCRFAITSPWMNTYWGGAVAATGGALAVGAWVRILRYARARDSVLFGLGLAVLAHSRPYEGFLLSIPLTLALLVWLLKDKRVPVRSRLRRVALPLALVAIALVGGTAYYNWRVTGNPLMMPYSLHQRTYGTPQSFLLASADPGCAGDPPSQRPGRCLPLAVGRVSYPVPLGHAGRTAQGLLALLPAAAAHAAAPVAARGGSQPADSRGVPVRRYPVGRQCHVPVLLPHYAAPLCGLVILLIVSGMRHLRRWRWRNHPIEYWRLAFYW